ncbi:putative ribonuclease H-like domain-containing protein, partial [Tanacetum coccineum]
MYSFLFKNVVPSRGLTCLFAKATIDESNLWHRRLGHINFKTKNKLVRGNLVRGLPSNLFENDHTCVACQKGKQRKASCKTKLAEAVSTACYVQNRGLVTKPHNKTPYELLHGRPPSISFMRLFGCLVTIHNTLDPLGKFDEKANDGGRPDWLFDIDLLTNSMNYEPVTTGNQTNKNAGIKDNVDAVPTQRYILLLFFPNSLQSPEDAVVDGASKKITKEPANKAERNGQEKEEEASNKEGYANNTNRVSTISPSVSATGQSFVNNIPTDPLVPNLEDTIDLLNTGIFSGVYDDEDVGAEADLNNLETTMNVCPIPTTRIHKDHPKDQIIGDINSATQTNDQKVWRLVDLPKCKHAIRTKWVYRNKKDKRGIVVRNKARLVAQGYTQEEGIDYDEIFALVARIEAIRLFLAYASFIRFIVYQIDVKSAFLYGTIEEEVYVCQPPGFEDPQFPDKVYKVEKALYGLHQAPKAWYEILSTYLLENGFRRGTIDKTLFIKKDKGDILLVQVYVDDIIFGSTKKSLCVEFEHMMHKRFQMSSIGELTLFLGLQVIVEDDGSSISKIITPKDSHLRAVKRIFRYLKGQPKLGLWYPWDSPFDLEAFSDSDYAGASLDRKSTTGDGIAADDEIQVSTVGLTYY